MQILNSAARKIQTLHTHITQPCQIVTVQSQWQSAYPPIGTFCHWVLVPQLDVVSPLERVCKLNTEKEGRTLPEIGWYYLQATKLADRKPKAKKI